MCGNSLSLLVTLGRIETTKNPGGLMRVRKTELRLLLYPLKRSIDTSRIRTYMQRGEGVGWGRDGGRASRTV